MDESALKKIQEIGTQLGRLNRSSKDSIVKLLRQAATALSQLEQPSQRDNDQKSKDIKKVNNALNPLKKPIIQGLLHHEDKDVKLMVAICVCEIFRVLAPELPFKDKYLKDIFKLIISIFAELADTTSPVFSKRVKILETVSRCKCCLIMLDLDTHCNKLILEMFNILFSVVRKHHEQSLINDILSIMSDILLEEASQSLVDVILKNLLKEEKGTPSASSLLASCLIQACPEKLGPFVYSFLSSCILNRDEIENDLKQFYHEIIFKIFQCAPQMLCNVIPSITQELLTDQVDVRIKAVNLIGKFFLLPEHNIAKNYHGLFQEFLRRFSDKSVDVRLSALQCAKIFCMNKLYGMESHEVLSAVEGRLLDVDDKVRMQAVIIACDLAKSNLKSVTPEFIEQTTLRLRDKKISIRKKALQKLMEVYHDYCKKCSDGIMEMWDHLETIPCKILMLCYEKDCKDFRSQNMELVLAEDLFPASLSVEERTRHWVHLFSLFNQHHLKALKSILSQKRRLQNEMQVYLARRKKEKENCSEDIEKIFRSSFKKMALSFSDPSKAEEGFHKLNNMKDNFVFNTLACLVDELEYTSSHTTRDKFLNMIGDKHPNFDFLRALSLKCSYNIFSSAHVRCILDHLSSKIYGSEQLDASSVRLLLAITSIFPMLLRGSEVKFLKLLSEDNSDKMIEVLAKAGSYISVKLSEIYPFLERLCLEGTRREAKFAVSAIAALIETSKESVFSKLCQVLVDALHSRINVPTVLQSLGCLAQHSVSTFEAQAEEITQFIYQNIFQIVSSDDMCYFEDSSRCNDFCKLKIFGLKTIVKSFLPHQGDQVKRQISEVLCLLRAVLQKDDPFDGVISLCGFSENDKACMMLVAAKSVLHLSRRWDLHISPDIFRLTISIAKDESSFVRRSFLGKTHILLKERAIPIRYACAYAFATSDCLKDIQEDSFRYLAEFVKEYNREAQIRKTSGVLNGIITEFPAYIVVFLIHLLAHDEGFPHENCQNEELHAQFFRPFLFVLQALVNVDNVNGDINMVKDAVMYLLCIFCAIKRAEDVIDIEKTLKLHLLSDIGFSFVTSVNHGGISLRPPGHVFLPSALYRANSRSSTQTSFNKCYIKRIIDIFNSSISLPDSTLCHQEHREDSIKSHISEDANDIFDSTHCKQVKLPVAGKVKTWKTLTRDISLGCGKKRAVSHSVSESFGLQECFGNELQNASEKSKVSFVKERPSSSSASIPNNLSSKELHVPTQNVHCNGTFSKETVGISGSIGTIHSKDSEGKLEDSCSLKENGESLVGKRIKLLSPVERSFYLGTVNSYNSQNSTHKITCDNGDIELLCLDSESFETISDDSLVQRMEDSEALNWQSCDVRKQSSSCCPRKSLEKVGQVVLQPKIFSNKGSTKSSKEVILADAKRAKGKKASTDTSESEVLDLKENAVLRRSRRIKV